EPKLRHQLPCYHASGKTVVLAAVAADDAAATPEDGPGSPILLQPERQQDGGMDVADGARAARQEQPGEKADVEAEAVLMQEAIFGGDLEVAEADVRRVAGGLAEAGRQDRRELEVGRRAVVEVDAGL